MDIAERHLLADVDLGNLLYEDKAPFESKNLYPNPGIVFLERNKLSHTSFNYSLSQVPKVREITRWERFARIKGITKHKKARKVWDESSQTWKPRWGKDRIDSNKEKWCIEVPDNADPYEDQFEKATKARNERKAKNEFSRLKNIARSTKKGQAPPVGVQPEADASKNHFNRALEIAKRSDASMGLFSAEVNEQKIASKTE
ncbi:unnamed protein product [Dibothriocephalus latus]|uniref:Ribosome biogenesis regulatory protein n=1 Tax=Dibothriocephalus latus TaxID=60516 RepID=A0A3P7LER8_DIBLA|nr:unnamed protein product [Dibothriocephalus latus]